MAILYYPGLKKILLSNGIAGYHCVPDIPVFVYHAVKDQVNSIAEVDDLVERYCGVGANILYQRNSRGGHVTEAMNGNSMAFEWLRDVLTGTYGDKYNSTECTVQKISVGADTPY